MLMWASGRPRKLSRRMPRSGTGESFASRAVPSVASSSPWSSVVVKALWYPTGAEETSIGGPPPFRIEMGEHTGRPGRRSLNRGALKAVSRRSCRPAFSIAGMAVSAPPHGRHRRRTMTSPAPRPSCPAGSRSWTRTRSLRRRGGRPAHLSTSRTCPSGSSGPPRPTGGHHQSCSSENTLRPGVHQDKGELPFGRDRRLLPLLLRGGWRNRYHIAVYPSSAGDSGLLPFLPGVNGPGPKR